jgi:DNA-binding transcriptional regulator GbsR (MarR family)
MCWRAFERNFYTLNRGIAQAVPLFSPELSNNIENLETFHYLYRMKYTEAKEELIQAWGNLGYSWGLNKTMGQIHALLMVSANPLSTEDIMQELSISRGNANMNIRALLDWGIISRVSMPGERKEYFKPEKDIWSLARQVARERRKRELEPVLKVLREVEHAQGDGSEDAKEFKRVVKELKSFAEKSDDLLETFIRAEESWFWNTVLKLMK